MNPGMNSPAAHTPVRLHDLVWLLGLSVVCLICLAYDFSGYPLLDPDEGRNAEVAREMYSSGDYVLPRLNGLPYVDKPALYFAAGAAVMKALGPTPTAARLPSLLFTFATITVVAWFGWHLFGSAGAWTAGVATAAAPFTVAYARTVIFDSALTFFVIVALTAFYLAVERTEQPEQANDSTALPPYRPTASGRRGAGGNWWTTFAWAAMALGVLTKGPVAVAVPLMVVVPYAIWRRSWRALADSLGVLLFAAILLPWLLAVTREVPDFLNYALVTETARRLTTDELQRTGPVWYFLAILPAAALPWTLVVAGSSRLLSHMRDGFGNLDGRVSYLLLWVVVPVLFFSLSQSKRPQYVLPLVPAVALLVAAAWHTPKPRYSGVGLAAGGLGLIGTALLLGASRIPVLFETSPAVAGAIPRTAVVVGAACIVGAAAGWLGRRHRKALLLALSIPVAAIPVSSTALMDAIGRERSAMEIAHVIRTAAPDHVLVVGVQAFPLSLPFYLQKTILLSTEDGSELTSNYIARHFDTLAHDSPHMLGTDWWREMLLACVQPAVFVVGSDDTNSRSILGTVLELLVDTGKYAAYGPCSATNLAALTQ